jgi:hypothetical protein
MSSGELYYQAGFARPYLKGLTVYPAYETGSTTTTTRGNSQTKNTSTQAMAPLLGWTQDDLQEGVPWKTGNLIGTGLGGTIQKALSREVRESLKGAKFDLKVKDLQDGLRAGKPFKVTGTYTSKLASQSAAESSLSESKVTITFAFGKIPVGEFVMFPVDTDFYKKWLPIPPKEDDATLASAVSRSNAGSDHNADDSKPLVMQVQFNAPNGQAPAKKVIEFFLHHVSRHKGLCINYPKGAAEKDDLKFKPGQSGLKIDSDGQHATTIDAVTSSSIVIEAHDTGAYGEFAATADGTAATYREATLINIPFDDNGNHIADGWEETTGVKDHPAAWDEENVPSGMKNSGDGLGAYEEYRGAMTGKKSEPVFRRLDPTKKKLLVYPNSPSAIDWIWEGVEKFATITKLKLYFVESEDWLENEGTDKRSRWLNFNSREDERPRGHKSLVVRVEEAGESGLHAGPIDGVDATKGYCPDKLKYVNFDKAFADTFVDGWTAEFVRSMPAAAGALKALNDGSSDIGNHGRWGLTPEIIEQKSTANKPTLKHQLVIYTMIHELGHALGARHHNMEDYLAQEAPVMAQHLSDNEADKLLAGPTIRTFGAGALDCPMRYWQLGNGAREQFLFVSLDWDPGSKSPLLTPWTWCADNWSEMRLHD